MAKRSRDWNEGLARDLQNPAFAREFLVAAIQEGISLQQALGKVIRAAGVKEFAARAGVASPNVLRAINPRHNPTQETLNRLLRPLGLRLSLALIEETRGKKAARPPSSKKADRRGSQRSSAQRQVPARTWRRRQRLSSRRAFSQDSERPQGPARLRPIPAPRICRGSGMEADV